MVKVDKNSNSTDNRPFLNSADDLSFLDFEEIAVEPKYDKPITPSGPSKFQKLPGMNLDREKEEAAALEMERRAAADRTAEPAVKEDLDVDVSVFDLDDEYADEEPIESTTLRNAKPFPKDAPYPDDASLEEQDEPWDVFKFDDDAFADSDTAYIPMDSADAYVPEGASLALSLGTFAGHPLDDYSPSESFEWFADNFSEDGSAPSGDSRDEDDFVPRGDYRYEDDFIPRDSDRFSYPKLQENRRIEEAAARAAAAKRERGGKGFKLGLAIYAVILILIFGAGNFLLYRYIEAYEETAPEYVVEQVIEDLKSGEYYNLNLETSDGVNISQKEGDVLFSDSDFKEYFAEKLKDDATYYLVQSNEDDDERTYIIQSGGADFVRVRINKTAQTQFLGLLNFWEESDASILNNDYTKQTFSIQVPSGFSVYVGDEKLNDSYIAGSSIANELVELQMDGIITEIPTYDIYDVTAIASSDDIRVVDENEISYGVVYNEDTETYNVNISPSDDLIEEAGMRIESIATDWSYYYAGDYGFWAMTEYLLANSPAYSWLESMETNYLWDHSSVSYTADYPSENFRQYSDTCFACDVTLTVSIWAVDTEEDSKTWDMTWIFIKSGDNYFLADIML